MDLWAENVVVGCAIEDGRKKRVKEKQDEYAKTVSDGVESSEENCKDGICVE